MLTLRIQTDADLTPKGKRSARIVPTSRGGAQLRWYVSGKRYRFLAPTVANAALTEQWIQAEHSSRKVTKAEFWPEVPVAA